MAQVFGCYRMLCYATHSGNIVLEAVTLSDRIEDKQSISNILVGIMQNIEDDYDGVDDGNEFGHTQSVSVCCGEWWNAARRKG